MSLSHNARRSFTTALAFCILSAASVNAQDPTAPSKTDPAPAAVEQYGSKSDQQGMQEIGKAYKDLHEAALGALQKKARDWNESGSKDPARGSDADRPTGADRDRAGSTGAMRGATASSANSLRGEELLIAASSDGLLAGAPSAKTEGIERDRNANDRDPDSKDSGSKDSKGDAYGSKDSGGGDSKMNSQGESVGMLLVCAYSGENAGSGSKRPTAIGGTGRGSDSDRAAREANAGRERADAMGTASRLEPGIYCIKQSGSSVWLANEKGETFLRTTIDRDHTGGTSGGSPTDRDRGTNDRDRDDMRDATGRDSASGTARGAKNDPEWEYIFGAITKEAMTHMGWAHQGTTRRGE